MKLKFFLVVLSALLTASVANGQETKKATPASKNQKTSVKRDMTLINRDQDELNQFRRKTDRFNKAYEQQDKDKLNKFKGQLVSDMKREINQGEKYSRRSKKELRRHEPGKELESRDIGEDRRTTRPNPDSRKAREDMKLRQREMRGNFKSLEMHRDIVRKQRGILNAFKDYDFAYKGNEADKRRGLLDEFAKSMNDDINLKRKKIEREKKRMKR